MEWADISRSLGVKSFRWTAWSVGWRSAVLASAPILGAMAIAGFFEFLNKKGADLSLAKAFENWWENLSLAQWAAGASFMWALCAVVVAAHRVSTAPTAIEEKIDALTARIGKLADTPLTKEQRADALREWCDKLNAQGELIVGASMSEEVRFMMAVRYYSAVRNLIFNTLTSKVAKHEVLEGLDPIATPLYKAMTEWQGRTVNDGRPMARAVYEWLGDFRARIKDTDMRLDDKAVFK